MYRCLQALHQHPPTRRFDNLHQTKKRGSALANIMQRLLQYKTAPSFANIFMSDLEERFLRTQSKRPLIWKWYIDDIFMIWTQSHEELQELLQQLNAFHQSIKFTYDISATEQRSLMWQSTKGKDTKKLTSWTAKYISNSPTHSSMCTWAPVTQQGSKKELP